jgi:DNA polymerase-3 subunit epsilon
MSTEIRHGAERQIVLDTETTGLSVAEGHRIIEIGCVEIIRRRVTGRHFHIYLNPDRDIDEGAFKVHGISRASLADKPRFSEVVHDFLDYVRGAEVLIHNAAFDVGFLDNELKLCTLKERMETVAQVTDTWALAKARHPGQKNGLDALCKRYFVDNSNRELHGALLDAQLLAEVYLAMTGGQARLALASETSEGDQNLSASLRALFANAGDLPLTVRSASDEEVAAHEQRLDAITAKAGRCLWRQSAD